LHISKQRGKKYFKAGSFLITWRLKILISTELKIEINEILKQNPGHISHVYSYALQGRPVPLASDVAFGSEG
jgi:hypothetical protein